MQGTILKYDKETHSGFISGHDGQRYKFTKVNFMSSKDPKEGVTVDFEANDKEAKDIVVLKAAKEKKEGGMKAPYLTFGVGLLMLFAAAMALEDEIADSDEVFGMGFWFVLVGLTGISTLMKQTKGRNWTIAGLVMATLAFLGVWGSSV